MNKPKSYFRRMPGGIEVRTSACIKGHGSPLQVQKHWDKVVDSTELEVRLIEVGPDKDVVLTPIGGIGMVSILRRREFKITALEYLQLLSTLENGGHELFLDVS